MTLVYLKYIRKYEIININIIILVNIIKEENTAALMRPENDVLEDKYKDVFCSCTSWAVNH